MNMRRLIVNLIVILALIGFYRYRSTHQPADPKDTELAGLPVGIRVTHLPTAVNAMTGRSTVHKYSWTYATTVRSTVGPLKIVEFGTFNWRNNRWVFATTTHKPFTSEDFAKHYKCPNAQLTADGEFTDPLHTDGSNTLPKAPQKVKCYYIGVDPTGTRYKGEATVDLLPNLAPGGI